MAFDHSDTRSGFPTIPLRLQLLKLQANSHQKACTFFFNELLERLTTLTSRADSDCNSAPRQPSRPSQPSCGVPPARPSFAMAITPSAGLNLGAATEEEIREFLGSISVDERQKVAEALKIVAAGGSSGPSGPVKLATSYIMQATDGGWGSYIIELKVNSDATGSVKEQVCTSEETPEVTELWSGNFRFAGDSVTFEGTEVEMMWDTGKVAELLGETQRYGNYGNMFSFRCFLSWNILWNGVIHRNLHYIYIYIIHIYIIIYYNTYIYI